MEKVRVSIELTATEAWHLADRAEAAGVSTSEFVRLAVIGHFGKSLTTRERVALLHRAGLTDGEISTRLKQTRQCVAIHRRSLGLEPRKKSEKKFREM